MSTTRIVLDLPSLEQEVPPPQNQYAGIDDAVLLEIIKEANAKFNRNEPFSIVIQSNGTVINALTDFILP